MRHVKGVIPIPLSLSFFSPRIHSRSSINTRPSSHAAAEIVVSRTTNQPGHTFTSKPRNHTLCINERDSTRYSREKKKKKNVHQRGFPLSGPGHLCLIPPSTGQPGRTQRAGGISSASRADPATVVELQQQRAQNPQARSCALGRAPRRAQGGLSRHQHRVAGVGVFLCVVCVRA